jgi:hypothetical protein
MLLPAANGQLDFDSPGVHGFGTSGSFSKQTGFKPEQWFVFVGVLVLCSRY